MMPRYLWMVYFCCLSTFLTAQPILLHSSQLDSLFTSDGSLSSAGFRQNGRAVGLLNGRHPATLIDSSGIVLVTLSALSDQPPIKAGAPPRILPNALPLESALISFPIATEDISRQILPPNEDQLSNAERKAHIQRKVAQMNLADNCNEGIRCQIIGYQQQSRFFRHYYRDYFQPQLLAYTQTGKPGDFALLRLPSTKSLSALPPSHSADSLDQAAYLINYPPSTHYHSSASALALHQSALQSSLSLLDSTIVLYASLGLLPPGSLVEFYEQQRQSLDFLLQNQALKNRHEQENAYLLYPSALALRQQLNQASEELQKLHRFYHLSQALDQSIQLLVLSRFLITHEEREISKERVLRFLDIWQQNWNPLIDQRLFQELMPLYLAESQASYFSTNFIDQIRSSGKSFEQLGEQLYSQSLLTNLPQLQSILEQQGVEGLYLELKGDVGYLFFGQLLKDQEQRVYRPYRDLLRVWTALEEQWIAAVQAARPFSFLDGNGTQRFHRINEEGLGRLPAWENTAGSPLFNARHELIGFTFPAYGGQSGVNWDLPQKTQAYQFLSWREVADLLKVLP